MTSSTVILNRFVLHSISPKRSVAFLLPSSFRLGQLLPHSHQRTPIRPSPRRYTVTAAAKPKTTSARTSRKSDTPTTSVPIKEAVADDSNASTLVIVESPAKASTIQSILPSSQYVVRSCVGHIREIPSSAKRIPAKYKEHDWASLGVDVTSDFRPIYVLISGKQSIVTDLRNELRRASRLVLATDDDREGEAISWHLLEVLKPTVPVHRAVFHEITPSAIQSAFENFRPLNMALVDAQETRRVLDRLAGYTMSPLLWKKISRGLSAGRVQSVAMSEIVRREQQRLIFKCARFSGCTSTFSPSSSSNSFQATLSTVDGIRLVRGSDFDDNTGNLRKSIKPESVRIYNQKDMETLCDVIKHAKKATITSIDCRKTSRYAPPPLITSTLQQECGNRLGMGAGRTMSVAQKLYETGVITYMRTDNPKMSDDAISACRSCIERLYGKEALAQPEDDTNGGGSVKNRSRKKVAKPKAAQAAHEAIRPAGEKFLAPNEVRGLSDIELSVYGIIYRRAVASQMAPAKIDQTTVKFGLCLDNAEGGERQVEMKATGSVLVKPGFLQLHQGSEEDEASSSFLPALAEEETVTLQSASVVNHETKPPPRFNDASLVKVLEERGVGRPSTYAGIIEKLVTRGYAYRGRDLPSDKKVPAKALVPSLTAFAVESLLSEHFPSFVDADFTAHMEKVLDEIAAGSTKRTCYLDEYYGGEDGLAESVKRKESDIDVRKFRQIILPNMPSDMIKNTKDNIKKPKKKKSESEISILKTEDGGISILKTEDGGIDWSSTKVLVNSYGPYIEQNGNVVASLPKTTLADDLCENRLESLLNLANDPVIGTDPESELVVLLKTSGFGPYLQLGRETDYTKQGEKPKRCGLSGIDVADVTLDMSLKLLSLPRLLGTHPESGLEIRAAIGPYGPYVVHGGNTYVSLKKAVHDVLEIGFEQALELVNGAEERKRKRLESQRLKAQERAKEDSKASEKKASGENKDSATKKGRQGTTKVSSKTSSKTQRSSSKRRTKSEV